MAEPAVTIRARHSSGGSNANPTRVVIHSTNPPGIGYPQASRAPQARNTADYFTLAASGGSAHYVEDDDAEVHTLPDNVIAWHAPPNERSIGIEICGLATYTRDQWLSASVWPAVARAARRTAELCARFGIPVVRLSVADLSNGHHGVCGHIDVSQAWHQSDHTDPGPEFPWDRFMAEVHGGNAPSAPTHPQQGTGGLYVVHGVQQMPSNPTFARTLQRTLGVAADGAWGPQTDAALRQFQRAHGLAGDGQIGPATARALGMGWSAT